MRPLRILVLASLVVLAACGSSGSKTKTTATTTASSTATTTAAAAGASINVGQTSLGAVLVNAQGRTLYHLTTESATAIKCTGQCANTWPPVTVASGQPQAGAGVTGTLTVVDRPDGTKQAAFDGQPLYTYAGDSKAGDTNGEGISGVWHAIKVGAAGAGATPAATTATTTARVTTTAGGGMGGY
jgi:predicted lipoprotein with Yx(FWY)xxD motif